MANDSVFREEVKSAPVKAPQKSGDGAGIDSTEVELPYTQYSTEKNHPYTVDHFKLGDSWQDNIGGFKHEVDLIEGYFKTEIESGALKDDISAVKDKMGKIYKLAGIDKNERTTMQIEKLAAYIEFENKLNNIRSQQAKYGRS